MENAAKMGEVLLNGLRKIERDHELVSNARGAGLMCAFDLPDGTCRSEFMGECVKRGMIVLPCGTKSIRFRPSLNVEEEHIERAIAIINEVLAEM